MYLVVNFICLVTYSYNLPTPIFLNIKSILYDFYLKLEKFRIKTHLRIVEQELLGKDVSHLTNELREERLKNIQRLRDYWIKGEFPQNIHSQDERVPYFKDHRGVPCAMAYLIEQSGDREIVKKVAETNNHVYINDISKGPVIDWITKSGLTKKEAARIQPAYGACGMFGDSCFHPLLIKFPLFPWIVSGILFVLLEVLSYFLAYWISPSVKSKRIISWLYFSVTNVVLVIFFFVFLHGYLTNYHI